MLEIKNTEINVDEIMRDIKKEIVRKKYSSVEEVESDSNGFIKELFSQFEKHHIATNFKLAEQNTNIGLVELPMVSFPSIIRWFARFIGRIVLYFSQVATVPQRYFNNSIYQALNITTSGVFKMESELGKIYTQFNLQNKRYSKMESILLDYMTENTELKSIIEKQTGEIEKNQKSMSDVNDYLSVVIKKFETVQSDHEELVEVNRDLVNENAKELENLTEDVQALKHMQGVNNERIDVSNAELQNIRKEIKEKNIQSDVFKSNMLNDIASINKGLSIHGENLQNNNSIIANLSNSLQVHQTEIVEFKRYNESKEKQIFRRLLQTKYNEGKLQKFEDDIRAHTLQLKAANDKYEKLHKNRAVLQRKINDLLSNTKHQNIQIKRTIDNVVKVFAEGSDNQKVEKLLEENLQINDSFLALFHDKFRGGRDQIKERVSVYVDYIKNARAGLKTKPVVDFGCGRGEWLEILKDENLNAYGVDSNKIMLEQCHQFGLDARQNDAIEYILSMKNSSAGAITAFHFLEHLQFENIVLFIDETVRVLRPGGVAIFETPNPDNVIVGTSSFYLDPTHIQPLPPVLLKYIAEMRGLSDVEIINLHPYSEEIKVKGDDEELVQRFNDHFYGHQDYAVIGYKR